MKKEYINILIGIIVFWVAGYFLYKENELFTTGFLLFIFLCQLRNYRKIDLQDKINEQIANSLLNNLKMIESNTKITETIIAYLQGTDKKAHLN